MENIYTVTVKFACNLPQYEKLLENLLKQISMQQEI